MKIPKILVVDDEKAFRESLKSYFSQIIACEIHCCANSDEALSLLKENTFDLVFLDIHMPGLSGIDLIKHLRKNNSAIYILVVSAWDDDEVVKKALKEDVDDFLIKPVPFEALSIKAKEILTKINKYLPISER